MQLCSSRGRCQSPCALRPAIRRLVLRALRSSSWTSEVLCHVTILHLCGAPELMPGSRLVKGARPTSRAVIGLVAAWDVQKTLLYSEVSRCRARFLALEWREFQARCDSTPERSTDSLVCLRDSVSTPYRAVLATMS